MKSFKDDYYSNLKFIKEISNGISYLPIIPTVYNVQLLKIMMPEGRFPDITDKNTNEKIFSIFLEIKNFLQKCAPYEETEENENRKSMQEKRVIIPELSEPPVRTLGATIPENESHIFR